MRSAIGILLAVTLGSACKSRSGECNGNEDCAGGQVCLVDHHCVAIGASAAATESAPQPAAAAAPPAAGSKLVVAKSGSGDGSITSDPAGIDCGATCAVDVLPGTRVRLTARPALGAVFTGWSGACTGTSVCDLSPDGIAQVTASFARASAGVAVAQPFAAPPPPNGPPPSPAPPPPVAPQPAVAVAPPPMCRGQCNEASLACKSRCKGEFGLGRDRHACLVSCETTEHDCKAAATCF
jgi:hypothetical protein